MNGTGDINISSVRGIIIIFIIRPGRIFSSLLPLIRRLSRQARRKSSQIFRFDLALQFIVTIFILFHFPMSCYLGPLTGTCTSTWYHIFATSSRTAHSTTEGWKMKSKIIQRRITSNIALILCFTIHQSMGSFLDMPRTLLVPLLSPPSALTTFLICFCCIV